MSKVHDFWDLITGAFNAMLQHIDISDTFQASPFAQVDGWGAFSLAYYLEPDPLTPDALAVRNPYATHDRFKRQIANLYEAGLLDDNHVATTDAIAAYTKLVDAQNEAIGKLDEIEANREAFNTIETLIDKVVAQIMASKTPPVPSTRHISRKKQPEGMPHSAFCRIGMMCILPHGANTISMASRWRHSAWSGTVKQQRRQVC